MIQEEGAYEKHIPLEYPLAEYYAYGGANTTPHIHCYSGGFHLKILTSRKKMQRINIIQDGKFLVNNLKDRLLQMDTNELNLNHEKKHELKNALLAEIIKYGFKYEEEPNDFDNIEQFREFFKEIFKKGKRCKAKQS